MRETRYEEVIKRSDGSRVRITVELNSRHLVEYRVSIHYCLPKKRTWCLCYSPGCWEYRALSIADRHVYAADKELNYVSAEEIRSAKLKLWEKLKP